MSKIYLLAQGYCSYYMIQKIKVASFQLVFGLKIRTKGFVSSIAGLEAF